MAASNNGLPGTGIVYHSNSSSDSSGSTVIVGLNGLRLLRASAWRKAYVGAVRP